MKKNILLYALIISLLNSCQKEIDPFLINKQNIGLLNDSTQVKDLQTAFMNDSIVKYVSGDEFTGNINDITIYDSDGKQLLVLTPSQSLDSTSTIKNIKIVDNRYKTQEGVTLTSTFKVIKDNYKISSIQNTLRSIIVSVNDINAYFTIDKEELPANMRFDMDLKIEAIQIPDDAKLKSFNLYWRN